MPNEQSVIGVPLLVFGIEQALFNIGPVTAVHSIVGTARRRMAD
jgi:hypothetical protein